MTEEEKITEAFSCFVVALYKDNKMPTRCKIRAKAIAIKSLNTFFKGVRFNEIHKTIDKNQLRIDTLNWKALKSEIEAIYDIDDLRAKCRKSEYISARTLAAKILREDYLLPLSNVGSRINKDHATVIHLIRQDETQIPRDAIRDIHYQRLIVRLKNKEFDYVAESN